MSILIPDTDVGCLLLIDILRYRASNQPNQVAYHFLPDQSDTPVTITYAELDRRAKALAAQLQKTYQPGERAVLLYPPGLELITAFFGCLYAGLIAVLANPPLNRRSILKFELILKNAKPACLLSTQSIQKKLIQLNLPEEKIKQLLANWLNIENIELTDIENWHYPAIDTNSVAFLQYTSGSTSDPKGVMVTQRNILHNISLISNASGLNAKSVVASWLPPYHDMGLIDGILVPLYAGVLSVLMSPASFLQNPFRWLKIISDYKVTATGGPNFGYDYCSKKITEEQKTQLNLSSWEVAFNGAEPIHAKSLEIFYKLFKNCGFRREAFYPCYGLAEATLFVSGAKVGHGYEKVILNKTALENNIVQINEKNNSNIYSIVSSGYLGQTVRIVDPDTQQECAIDKIGEIWVHSPSVTAGYWKNPEKTKETFQNYLADDPNKAYLRTGDLGFIHNNNLYITGRLKDLIIIRGRNLYPHDIGTTVSH